ncbi:hypothetical protein [Novosphingobium sp.]|uniref:hypothetical protein n=1 Tax=Novosphingobium sp. TaxID=1874826 RepID=UPI003B52EB36
MSTQSSLRKIAAIAICVAMASYPALATTTKGLPSFYCYDAAVETAPAEFKFSKIQLGDKDVWQVTLSDGHTYATDRLPRTDPPPVGTGEAFGWEGAGGNRKVAVVDFSDVIDASGPKMATLLLLAKDAPNGKKYQCIPSVIALGFKGKDRPGF